MKKTSLSYQLADGYVHDWLILGPCDTELPARPAAAASAAALPHQLPTTDDARPDFDEVTELDRAACEDSSEARYWEAARCEADHLLDFSTSFQTHTRRRVWAYVTLATTAAQAVTLQLFTTCPTTVWLNGRPVRFDGADAATTFTDQALRTFTHDVSLRPRDNRLLVRLEQMAIGDAVMSFGLRIVGDAAPAIKAKLTTLTLRPKDRLTVERAYQFPYLERAVLTADDVGRLLCPPDTPGNHESVVRLQTPEGWIYGESHGTVKAGAQIAGVYGVQLPAGPMQAILMP
ncbi:MAG: hypothetical protein N2439_07415, partial [Anaerolineae bacterium]|nr:hypothetical protein [Anaerolineae bacterium]